MTILNNVLIVLIFLTSILLTLTVLMHKGQGGGLSDMFGGGISSSAGSSGVAERNLNRITLGTLLIWLVCIIGYALLAKFGACRLSRFSHGSRRVRGEQFFIRNPGGGRPLHEEDGPTR